LEAVVLILKHATFLCISKHPKFALAQADLDYQRATIDLKVQEHLEAYSPVDSVEQSAAFIMVTEIGVFLLLPVTILSHYSFSTISVFSDS
jgi:hypothetical protein